MVTGASKSVGVPLHLDLSGNRISILTVEHRVCRSRPTRKRIQLLAGDDLATELLDVFCNAITSGSEVIYILAGKISWSGYADRREVKHSASVCHITA